MKSGEEDEDFGRFWMLYPKRPGDNRKEAFRQWKARINAGEDPVAIWAGTARYAEYCKQCIDDPRFIKKAATFIGRDQHYLLEWRVHKKDKSANFDRWLTGNTGDENGIIDI